MLTKALFAAALASSTASAFLLPPPSDFPVAAGVGGDKAKSEEVHTLPFLDHLAMKGKPSGNNVMLPCPGCPVVVQDPEDDSKKSMSFRVPSLLGLDFSVATSESHDSIVLNGYELYPDVDVLHSALTANQYPFLPPFPPPKGHEEHDHHEEHHHGKEHEHDREHDHHEEHHGDKEREHHHEEHHGDKKPEHGHHEEHHDDKKPEKAEDASPEEIKRDFPKLPMGMPKLPAMPKLPGMQMKTPAMTENVPLGYSLQMHSEAHDEGDKSDESVLTMTLKIIEVNNYFVRHVPALMIRVARKGDNRLEIVDIEMEKPKGPHHPHGIPPPPPPSKAEAEAELARKLAECSNFLCRWKVSFASHMKPHSCGGNKMAQGKGDDEHQSGNPGLEGFPGSEGFHGHGAEDGEPFRHPHHPHHHSHHPHHEHGFTRGFGSFVSNILIPVFIGLTAGVISGVIGMIVASLLAVAYRRFVRRERSSRRNADKATVVEEGAADEKAGLMAVVTEEEETETLPAYKDKETESV